MRGYTTTVHLVVLQLGFSLLRGRGDRGEGEGASGWGGACLHPQGSRDGGKPHATIVYRYLLPLRRDEKEKRRRS